MQMAGPSALATDDIMEVMRSVLAQVLPVTYSDVDPQAYKNVTVCPVVDPAPAPLPAQQNPGTPGQASGWRRLQVGKLDGKPPMAMHVLTRVPNALPYGDHESWGGHNSRRVTRTVV